jgi:hypothetical protein
MTNEETAIQLSNTIELFADRAKKDLPDRFEFEVEVRHHNDKNHALIEELKGLLVSKGYNTYEAWNKEYDTKRFTFYKPPGRAPY